LAQERHAAGFPLEGLIVSALSARRQCFIRASATRRQA